MVVFDVNLGPVVNDGIFLKNELLPSENLFSVAHLNCCSIRPAVRSSKFDEIKNVLVGSCIDAVGVSETWLTKDVTSRAVSIPGYKFFRNDRVGMRGGGVGIYISENIKSKVVYKHSSPCICESLFVEICVSGHKVLFGVVYLPPPADFASFDDIHQELFLNYSNIIVVGDFNFNLFDSSKSSIVHSYCNRLNFSVCHNSIPSHYDVQHGSTSLIDYMLISRDLKLHSSGQAQCPSISHHALIYASFEILKVCQETFTEYRDLNNIDWPGLLSYLSSFDVSLIFAEDDVNLKFQVFSTLIQELYSFVPKRRRRVNEKGDKWMKTESVLLAFSYRDLAFSTYRRNPTHENWKVFCKYRNRAKSTIRRERMKYYSDRFSRVDQAGMWRILKNAGCGGSEELVFDGNIDCVNEYFAGGPGGVGMGEFDFDQFGDQLSGFSFHCVSESDVYRSLNRVKSKAVGIDNIGIGFLKLIYPYVSDVILHLINTILTTSIFPADWKVARVVPIPKTGHVSGPSDLRPISILPALSKVVEHIIKDQIIASIGDMITDSQFAFRRGHSTTSLLVGLTDTVRQSANDGRMSVLVSLDLTKAFNSICFSTLITLLRDKFSFSKSACRLIMSYISDRRQFVNMRGKNSCLLPLRSGVPQGSVLGPLLFLLYVNELPRVIECNMCTPFLFADDIFLLFNTDIDFPDVLEANINYCLDRVTTWLDGLCLSVNPTKSKVMFFNSNRFHLPVFNISICNTPIEIVSQQRCLGIIIDSGLSFEAHFCRTYAKIACALRMIYSMGIYLSVDVRKRIAHALMMPHVLYCLEVVSGAGSVHLGILKRAVNSIVRFVFSVRRREHISSFVKNFLGCNFEQFIKIRNMNLFYNIIKRGLPNILREIFVFSRSTRNKQILIPRIRCLLFERSFLVRIARIWNGLPIELRIFSHSNNMFRLKLLDYFQ